MPAPRLSKPSRRRLPREVAGITIHCLADLPVRPQHWLWPGHLPADALSLLVGDPGLGKSFLALDLVARLTSHRPMPGHSSSHILRPADALLITAEDDPRATIRPRLEALGADLTRVHTLAAVRADLAGQRTFSAALDFNRLAHVLNEYDKRDRPILLVVIDPITAFLGADAHHLPTARRVLTRLANLATNHRTAVLAITHLNKRASRGHAPGSHADSARAASGGGVLHRTQGSIAFTAVARSVLAIAHDPLDPTGASGGRRLIGPIKQNLAAPTPTLAFRITDPTPPHTAASLVWDDAPVHTTLTALLQSRAAAPPKGPTFEAARTLLRTELAAGPRPADDLIALAESQGIPINTLRRAKAAAGVESVRTNDATTRGAGKWMWVLSKGATGGSPTSAPL